MTNTDTSITLATVPDLPDILSMICVLSACHGDTAQVQLQHAFFGPTPVATTFIAKLNGNTIGYVGLILTLFYIAVKSVWTSIIYLLCRIIAVAISALR